MERQPQLAEAVITALTSDDEAAGRASISTTDVMTRVMLQAFPDDVDPATEAAIAKVLGHVWFSCMVAWKNGVGDMTWMAEELADRLPTSSAATSISCAQRLRPDRAGGSGSCRGRCDHSA